MRNLSIETVLNLLNRWVESMPKDKDGKFVGPNSALAEQTLALLKVFYDHE